MKKLFMIVALLTMFVLPVSANEAEYTVDETGITLPRELQAHDHVNVRFEYAENGDVKSFTANIHLDPNNNHPGGALQGLSKLKWKDWNTFATEGNKLPLGINLCVAWVQVAGYNYHYGENGESVKNQPCFEVETPEVPEVPETPETPEVPTDPTLPETGIGDDLRLPLILLLSGVAIIIVDMKIKLRKEIK